MKQAVKTLIKAPAAFVILILLLLLVLLFAVKAANKGSEVVNKIEQGNNITSVEYPKAR